MNFPQQVVPASLPADKFALAYGDEAHYVERAAMMQIVANLEEECERQESNWRSRDIEFADLLGPSGVEYQAKGIQIERVQPQNFFIGARPSLVNASADFYPSITTRSAQSSPARDQGDQFDILDVQLTIEILCKSDQVPQDQLHRQRGIDAEGDVNRQVHLLAAAVQSAIRRDPSCGGRILPPQRPPQKTWGLPSALPGDSAERSGPYRIYKGCRMRYVVQVNSY
jgi:hypothetical protein